MASQKRRFNPRCSRPSSPKLKGRCVIDTVTQTPKAIYRVIPLSKAGCQETLIYNLRDGFSWVRKTDDNSNSWHCIVPTAIEAEKQARKAGFNPTAIAYIP